MIKTIEISDNITYDELYDLLNNVSGHHVHLADYERLKNGYRLFFENKRESKRVDIDDFLYIYERTDQLKINFNFNIDFYHLCPEIPDYMSLYLPELKKYIEDEEISEVKFNIFDEYNFINRERIEERINIHRKYYNTFKEKAENNELSALVLSGLIYKFHNGEDLDSCQLNLDLYSIDAGILKYLESPITLEQLFNSNCYNKHFNEDTYLTIYDCGINFIKKNQILICNNPSVYLDRPEIKFLNCLSKYFNKLEMSR